METRLCSLEVRVMTSLKDHQNSNSVYICPTKAVSPQARVKHGSSDTLKSVGVGEPFRVLLIPLKHTISHKAKRSILLTKVQPQTRRN